jgi:hypothetical protein
MKEKTWNYLFTAILVFIAWIPFRLYFEDLSFIKTEVLFPVVFSAALSVFFQYGFINIKKLYLVMHVLVHAFKLFANSHLMGGFDD